MGATELMSYWTGNAGQVYNPPETKEENAG